MAEVLINSAVAPTGTPDTTLNNGGTLTSGATSLVVASLPLFVSSAQFRIRIDDELLIVTAISGTGNKTWTVTRGAEGTTAASHADGSSVYLVPTAGGMGQWLADHNPAFSASGGGHAQGLVPDPGATAGAERFLCEAATFVLPGCPFIILEDQKTQNTNGGGLASGSWVKRTLNTKVEDTGSHCTLSSSQFALDAGTYVCFASAPGYEVGRFQIRLQNVSDSATVAYGANSYDGVTTPSMNRSQLQTCFTIASSKTFEIDQHVEITNNTNGGGVEGNFGTEVYAQVLLWKIA